MIDNIYYVFNRSDEAKRGMLNDGTYGSYVSEILFPKDKSLSDMKKTI
jgi:hypothetical protein